MKGRPVRLFQKTRTQSVDSDKTPNRVSLLIALYMNQDG